MFIQLYSGVFMYRKIGITACSDPLKPEFQKKMEQLCMVLKEMNIEPVLSPCLYDRGNGFSGTGRERAEALMDMYRDTGIDAIFDLSGGDMANAVIPYLDFGCMQNNPKTFFGYSDLTTILNAIYSKTGQPSTLYQLRNLLYDDRENQRRRFKCFAQTWGRETFSAGYVNNFFKKKCDTVSKKAFELFDFPYLFVQGERMEGTLIGGNIRCFLKLAGTGYMPEFEGKILLLEACGGGVPQMVTYLSQLKMLQIFEKINGIVLGTFTQMEENRVSPDMTALVRSAAGNHMPIVKTAYVGHGCDARAALLGGYYVFEKNTV